MKFTENLRSTVEAYTVKIRAAEKAIADHHKNGITEYSYERYKEIAAELEENRAALRREGLAAVQRIIDEYKAGLPKRFAVSGADIDDGDVVLLNGAYQLSAADINVMLDKYMPGNGAINHTMVKLIRDYCEKHDIQFTREYHGEAEKAAAADILRNYAASSFDRPNYGLETTEYFSQIIPECLIGD